MAKASAKKTTKLLVAGVVLMVIAGLGPWMILTLFGQPNAANVAILPSVAVTIACVTGAGWETGLIVVAPFALLAGLSAWASPYPWLAALVLAIAAFLRGYAARIGLHDALILIVISLGFIVALPPTFTASMPDPLLVGLVVLGSGIWVTAVIFTLRKLIPPMKHVHLEAIRVDVFSIMLAILVGGATYFVASFNLGQTGGWIILTILVVFQPYFGIGIKKAGSRALGTVIGFVIAVVVGLFFPTGNILYLFGAIFIVIAFLFILQGRPYWQYAVALTPAVVLMDSAQSKVNVIAMERLKGTFVGIAVTLLVMLALMPLNKYLEAKSNAPQS